MRNFDRRNKEKQRQNFLVPKGEGTLITIRPFEMMDEDYQHAVDIVNSVWVEYPNTVDEWKESDEKRSKKVKWGRFFAEVEGRPVGIARYSQSLWVNHPGKLWMDISVRPEFRKRGIGTALWQHLRQQTEQFDPLRLYTNTREDFTDSVRFVQKLGFTERMREWESRLDPASVPLADWVRYPQRMAEQGIEIKTVAELASDPNRDRKLYELEWAIDQDIPSPEPPTKVPFEEFQKVWERTNLLTDGWFVAIDNGEYVGMSNLWLSQAARNILYTGLTGVVRSYRKRGVATALKLRAIEYAREKGVGEVRTWNESNNQGMLDINVRLGFVRQPAHLDFVKDIRPERPEDAEMSLVDNTAEEAIAV